MQANIVRYPSPLVLAALTSIVILTLLRIRADGSQVVLEQALPLTVADASASSTHIGILTVNSSFKSLNRT